MFGSTGELNRNAVIAPQRRVGRYTMTPLLIIVIVVFSGSAYGQMGQFHKSDGTSGRMYGTIPNSIEEYLDSRRNNRTEFNNSESDISQHYFNGPNGMRQDSGTIFNTPMSNTPVGNTPMGLPQSVPEIQQMAPAHPFGSGLVPTPWGR